jgi:hypothetical protein
MSATKHSCASLIEKFEELAKSPEHRNKISLLCDYKKNKCIMRPQNDYCEGMETASNKFDNLMWKYSIIQPMSVFTQPYMRYQDTLVNPDLEKHMEAFYKRKRHDLQRASTIKFVIQFNGWNSKFD